MLNVGSNYTSFSNYSPACRARCGQGERRCTRAAGGTYPLTRPGPGQLGPAGARGRAGGRAPVGGAAGSGGRAAGREGGQSRQPAGAGARRFSGVCREGCAAAAGAAPGARGDRDAGSCPPRQPSARREPLSREKGGLAAAGGGCGGRAEGGSGEKSRGRSRALSRRRPSWRTRFANQNRPRLHTESRRATSPRPSSEALCITAITPLSLYLAVLGLLLQGTLLQPVHGVLGRGGEVVSAQAAPFLHLGARVRRSVAHCWETRRGKGVRGWDRDAEDFAPGWRRLPLPTGRSQWGRA